MSYGKRSAWQRPHDAAYSSRAPSIERERPLPCSALRPEPQDCRMPELRAREQSMRAELQAILDQAADRMSFLRLAETLTAFLKRLRESAQSLEIIERQKVVRLLVKEVLVDNDTITIRHSIPSHPKAPLLGGDEPPPSNGKSRAGDQSYLLRSGSGVADSGQPVLALRTRHLPGVRFPRYADDAVLHCNCRRQAPPSTSPPIFLPGESGSSASSGIGTSKD
jgi:hypothetical protein